MPNLRGKTWTETTPAKTEDAQFWEDHMFDGDKYYDKSSIDNKFKQYDSDGDGIVDNAKKVNNHTVDRNVSADEYSNEQIDEKYKEVEDARTGYNGEKYDNLNDRINGDINGVLDKVGTVNYKDTTIHANNTYARNLVANRNKVEVLGQTIQNCLDHSSADKFSSLSGSIADGYIVLNKLKTANNTKKDSAVLKPNTKYTFIIEMLENGLINDESALLSFGSDVDSTSVFNGAISIKLKGFLGTYKKVQTTYDTDVFNTKRYSSIFGVYQNVGEGSIKFRYAIVEGDWTQKEISFVPFGLNYPETTEVIATGKNILNLEEYFKFGNLAQYVNIDGNKVSFTNLDNARFKTPLRFSDRPIYVSLSGTVKNDTSNNVRLELLNNGKFAGEISNVKSKVENILADSLRLNYTNVGACTFENLQLEINSVATEYEPYTERRININKPLASIDETIRDRYYVKDGKKYHDKIVDKYTFTGDENIILWPGYPTDRGSTGFNIRNLLNYNLNTQNWLCDKIEADRKGVIANRNTIRLRADGDYSLIYLIINNSELETLDVAGAKKWLKQKQPTLIYELATPITTEIQTEDMQSFDGQTNITTTNTVKPTLDIDIPSDLTAVVSDLMVENTSLKQKNQSLSNELENQKSSIETQQANVDYISMMTGVEL